MRHARTARPSCAHCLNRIKKRKQRNAKHLQEKRVLAAYYSVAHFVLFCFAVSKHAASVFDLPFLARSPTRCSPSVCCSSPSAMHVCLCLKWLRLLTHAPRPDPTQLNVPCTTHVSLPKLPLSPERPGQTQRRQIICPRRLCFPSSSFRVRRTFLISFYFHAYPPPFPPQITMAARRLFVPLSLCLATASAFFVAPPQVRREGGREDGEEDDDDAARRNLIRRHHISM